MLEDQKVVKVRYCLVCFSYSTRMKLDCLEEASSNTLQRKVQGVIRLTLRLIMSYIYIYIYIYIYMEHLFLMFLDHTQRRSTVGRTPLDE